jgi:uncharacterized membrane protein
MRLNPVYEGASLMKRWDRIAFAIGVVGFILVTTGVALMHVPTALIVAGSLLLIWSYLAARAGATAQAPQR